MGIVREILKKSNEGREIDRNKIIQNQVDVYCTRKKIVRQKLMFNKYLKSEKGRNKNRKYRKRVKWPNKKEWKARKETDWKNSKTYRKIYVQMERYKKVR